jgi:hypothetical protein
MPCGKTNVIASKSKTHSVREIKNWYFVTFDVGISFAWQAISLASNPEEVVLGN